MKIGNKPAFWLLGAVVLIAVPGVICKADTTHGMEVVTGSNETKTSTDVCNLGNETMRCSDGTTSTIPLEDHILCHEKRRQLCRIVEPKAKDIAYANCSNLYQGVCKIKDGYNFTEPMTQGEAEEACKKMGGQLAIVCPQDKTRMEIFRSKVETYAWVNNETIVAPNGNPKLGATPPEVYIGQEFTVNASAPCAHPAVTLVLIIQQDSSNVTEHSTNIPCATKTTEVEEATVTATFTPGTTSNVTIRLIANHPSYESPYESSRVIPAKELIPDGPNYGFGVGCAVGGILFGIVIVTLIIVLRKKNLIRFNQDQPEAGDGEGQDQGEPRNQPGEPGDEEGGPKRTRGRSKTADDYNGCVYSKVPNGDA